MDRPRVTVVVPVHNAAYGGRLLHRLQVCLNAFAILARRYGLRCELLVVEWNTAPGATRIRELIRRPEHLGPATLRFVEVPAEVHATHPQAQLRPFHSAAARNTGVRRAQGEWILVTGADALPNLELGSFLAAAELDPDAFYRVDRRDLTEPVPVDASLDHQLRLASRQPMVVHTYYGDIHEARPLDLSGRIRTWRSRRLVLAEYERTLSDPTYVAPPVANGDRLILPADNRLHRNGSGDFFLMHRDRWHDVRGFTELPTRGHTDSILCWTVSTAGLRQQILNPPIRLYHQYHDREASSSWPQTDWRVWHARYVDCLRNGTRMVENGEDWGLRDHDLPEFSAGA